MSDIIVSVIIPILNEERFISSCIDSLYKQDYPTENMEWLFVDGGSKDDTVKIIKNYLEKNPQLIKILPNPNRTQSYAMNIGIRNSIGKYIIRMDAHAEYDCDYLSQCVKILDSTNYDNVGGIARTRARTKFGNVIALMLSSKFGVGNSQFRTTNSDGLVDTVPFGAFRRSTFEKYGCFDERLGRNEDNEINYRIRKNGGRVYLSSSIKFTYYCRDTLTGILKMAFQNGKWTVIASRLCPGSMSLRHWIPFAFVLSIIVLGLLGIASTWFIYLLACELALYFFLAIIFAIKAKPDFIVDFELIILFPLFHIFYGIGSAVGLFGIMTNQRK